MSRARSKKEEPVEAESDIVMDEAPTSHQPEDDMSVDQDENDEAGDVEEDDVEEEEDVQRVRLVCGIFQFPKGLVVRRGHRC
jgi:DNA-directed RNA polymerase I and III subunit RPAC2